MGFDDELEAAIERAIYAERARAAAANLEAAGGSIGGFWVNGVRVMSDEELRWEAAAAISNRRA